MRHVWNDEHVHAVHCVGYEHVLVQVRDWHVPQPDVETVPGRHAPSPMQAPYGSQ